MKRIALHKMNIAKTKHNTTVNKWNDKIYNGSIEKNLGFENYGQFVTPVITC